MANRPKLRLRISKLRVTRREERASLGRVSTSVLGFLYPVNCLHLRYVMGEKEYEATYKILILGDSGVGKTCLIFRFIEDVFSDSYISTIGKLFCKSS